MGYFNIYLFNCVTKCFYFYYYNSYGQYKCTKSNSCPEEAKFTIKGKNKCTNDCKKESLYQYGGQCNEECPQDTILDNNICINNIVDSCTKNEIELVEFLSNEDVDINIKRYSKEFGYTMKHVSLYYNNLNSLLIYKDKNCIEELNINMPTVDFGLCYRKISSKLEPPTTDKLIVALFERKNDQKISTTSYFFYHPETGEKLDIEELCKNDEVVIKESVLSKLNNSDIDLKDILYLTGQEINIFNLSDDFYTDICYHFNSPNGKDVPLQDRVKSYYPNLTLTCDYGCINKGINLSSMESICQCKLSDLMNKELIKSFF